MSAICFAISQPAGGDFLMQNLKNSPDSMNPESGTDEAFKAGMNITTARITKAVLFFTCLFTLFMTTGCLVEERERHHDRDRDRDVIVAPAPPPAVIVRPPEVIVH